jgi:hypothetical protein
MCPACESPNTQVVRVQGAQGAAEHFVPWARDAARHNAGAAHIEQLWGAPTAEIMPCGTWGFGFVSPWVSGDGEFL